MSAGRVDMEDVDANSEPIDNNNGSNDQEFHEPTVDLVLDALPYFDEDGDRDEVDLLIALDMKRKDAKQPEDYLKEITARAPTFSLLGSAFAQSELERVAEGKPQTPFDDSRYTVTPPPKSERNNLAAWEAAVANAAAQIEHQNNRLANLELMKKFGANAWKAHTLQLETQEVDYHARIAVVKNRMDEINRKRKIEQTAAGTKLDRLRDQFNHCVQKTYEIEAVSVALEKDVKRLKSKAVERGLIKPDQTERQ